MRFFAVALSFFGVAASFAQTPEVPHKMQFAGMTLTIRDDARREIQNDVDALTQHSRYFTMKVERARTYFPMIEKIFDEEGLPKDFKYLVLQESALVADAVSVSNAVGFWQFKDFTAVEMGLRVDKDIDERMNLVSATHGAARYLKQNNYRFNNWLLALQSYQMGAGGVMRSVGDVYNGAKNMEITSETYWYVKKFLAHKVAFEEALPGEAQLKVIAYPTKSKKTLKEIAAELSAEEEELKEYNKWLKSPVIPDDKEYTVFVPVGKRDMDFTKLILVSDKAGRAKPLVAVAPLAADTLPVQVNGLKALVARPGESITSLALRGKTDLSDFLKFNETAIDHAVQPGTYFFLEKKKTKGSKEFHKVKAGEDLWLVSQQFGVRVKNLRKYNEVKEDEPLPTGSTIWLQGARPADAPVLLDDTEVATLDTETFDWYTKSPKEAEPRDKPAKPETGTPDPLPVAVKNISDTGVQTPSTKATEHIVKPGDTFYSIARLYGVEVTDLLNWNNLTIQGGLKPDQVIKVVENEPVSVEVKTPKPTGVPTVHEVKSSDTLYSIARQYGVTIKDIMDWNHKTDFSLTKGEKLEIRQK